MPRRPTIEPAKRPPRKPPRRPRVKGKGPDRYVICPGSGLLHPGAIALLVTRNGPKRRPTALCGTCRTRIFLPPRFTKEYGLTRGQAEAHDAQISQI